MCNSTVVLLNSISQQVIIYMGFFLFVIGLIGNLLTLLVFLSLETLRQSSCAFYLIIMSIVNTFHLFTGLLTFIMINGFAINWTNTSLFYCKFRPFCVQVCISISFSCMCLATIDQFLATLSNTRWHQFNNIKLARSIVIGITIIWILCEIPFIIYYGNTLPLSAGKFNCIMTNDAFRKYYNYFHGLILSNILPLLIVILFGILAYRNVQKIAYRTVPLVRRELDKQLTVMVLVQVFYDTIALTPLAILLIYNDIPDKSLDACGIAILNIFTTLFTLLYYFHFVGSFFIYICVSKRFRQQLIHVLFTNVNRYRPRPLNNNQIQPQTS
ncbi:unnamed protein product [Adineta steineri]|uniref:G-protein coupled receptors family 1 profile domain-containing protein n=1 Tax=Adineta steineri TaxID=433720 RepID=A0A818PDS0_9BILA|nr:unnamed protein product [Adineta steineri]CAF3618550.1 unnamed protein product [Adineta steineri]